MLAELPLGERRRDPHGHVWTVRRVWLDEYEPGCGEGEWVATCTSGGAEAEFPTCDVREWPVEPAHPVAVQGVLW